MDRYRMKSRGGEKYKNERERNLEREKEYELGYVRRKRKKKRDKEKGEYSTVKEQIESNPRTLYG